jgi:hypothetical protein
MSNMLCMDFILNVNTLGYGHLAICASVLRNKI